MLFHFLLDPDPELIIPDPDPGKSSGSDRIRNTATYYYIHDKDLLNSTVIPNIIKNLFITVNVIQKISVVDPKLFIPDPDPALNFPSSGSGSRQKFRIHADPDPTYIN